MNPTEDKLETAIEGLGDNLKPITEEPAKPVVEDPKDPVEDPAKEKDPKDDPGFTAAELDDDTPNKPDPTPEKKEVPTEGLSAEDKYIVDNLPYLTARLKVGNTVKEMQVKSWTQLPEDMEFASKRDELAFVNALQAQENRAQSLQTTFRQDQQTAQSKQYEEQENAMIQEDVTELQKAGELPRFKTKASDPDFDKDPATQQVQKVMDFMEGRNKQYLAEYQQGRPFRHIGFREAFYMFERQNPDKPTVNKREDDERRDLADKLTGNRGLTSTKMKKATVRSGTRIDDILDRIETEW